VHIPQQHAHDSLLRISGNTVVVVHDGEQHEGVQDHLCYVFVCMNIRPVDRGVQTVVRSICAAEDAGLRRYCI